MEEIQKFAQPSRQTTSIWPLVTLFPLGQVTSQLLLLPSLDFLLLHLAGAAWPACDQLQRQQQQQLATSNMQQQQHAAATATSNIQLSGNIFRPHLLAAVVLSLHI